MKQGEEALQRSISILSEQEGWTLETVAVSTHKHTHTHSFSTQHRLISPPPDWWPFFLLASHPPREDSGVFTFTFSISDFL